MGRKSKANNNNTNGNVADDQIDDLQDNDMQEEIKPAKQIVPESTQNTPVTKVQTAL